MATASPELHILAWFWAVRTFPTVHNLHGAEELGLIFTSPVFADCSLKRSGKVAARARLPDASLRMAAR